MRWSKLWPKSKTCEMAPDFRPSPTDPAWAPILADESRSRVLWARLGEDDYRSASFLDQRLVQAGLPTHWTDWHDVIGAARGLAERANFIFHVGHVGSTLISRLLGIGQSVHAIREPALLRSFAEIAVSLREPECPWSGRDFEDRLTACLRLWSRVFRPGQKSLIKATSFASELAGLLAGRTAGARALVATAAPAIYAATILGGPASRLECLALAPSRLRRLHRRIGASPWTLSALSEGEVVAMSWATEMSALALLPAERVLWADFDAFLADIPATLRRMMIHLEGDVRELDIAAMAVSPSLRRYSKAPDHPYDAATRMSVIRQAQAEHATEIRRGLTWLAKSASTYPQIAAALGRYPL
jgi:hypothetical protein